MGGFLAPWSFELHMLEPLGVQHPPCSARCTLKPGGKYQLKARFQHRKVLPRWGSFAIFFAFSDCLEVWKTRRWSCLHLYYGKWGQGFCSSNCHFLLFSFFVYFGVTMTAITSQVVKNHADGSMTKKDDLWPTSTIYTLILLIITPDFWLVINDPFHFMVGHHAPISPGRFWRRRPSFVPGAVWSWWRVLAHFSMASTSMVDQRIHVWIVHWAWSKD